MDHKSFTEGKNSYVRTAMTKLQERVILPLVVVAGYVDVVAYMNWKSYASFMSGNTTQLGIYISRNIPTNLILSISALVLFVVGICVGTCIAMWKRNKVRTLPFIIASVIFTAYSLLTFYYAIYPPIAIGILAFTMGIMNTVITNEGDVKVNAVYITGTLNNIAINLASLIMSRDKQEISQARSNVFHLSLIWLGFLLGTVSGAFLHAPLGKWVLAIPILLLILGAFNMHFACKKYLNHPL